jgi:hypothetical protein
VYCRSHLPGGIAARRGRGPEKAFLYDIVNNATRNSPELALKQTSLKWRWLSRSPIT